MVRREYAMIRAEALELADRDILDDSDNKMSAKEAKKIIDEGKRQRKEVRDRAYKVLLDDAEAVAESRRNQVEVGRKIIRMLELLTEAIAGKASMQTQPLATQLPAASENAVDVTQDSPPSMQSMDIDTPGPKNESRD